VQILAEAIVYRALFREPGELLLLPFAVIRKRRRTAAERDCYLAGDWHSPQPQYTVARRASRPQDKSRE
jgi:hypothetical protein